MDVSSITSGTNVANSSSTSLSETFDTFLLLLTKQLKYQDPLSPMDTNEFTSQLVQYTEVEQSIATNKKLEDLLALQGTNQAMSAMSFLGTTVEVSSNQIDLSGGVANFEYEADTATTGTTISIIDGKGNLVRVLQGDKGAGEHSYSWDGKDADGKQLSDGVYTIQVTGKSQTDTSVKFETRAVGKVSGVEIRDGEVLLSIGSLQALLDDVHAVRASEEAAS